MNEDGKIPGGKGGWIMPRKKGDPATPGGGRPKGSKDTKARIRKLLETTMTNVHPVTGADEDVDILDMMLVKMAKKVLEDGDTSAFNAILDRLDGKPIQYVGADPETQESQKQFDNLSLDELMKIRDGKKDDFTEFEDKPNT